MNPSFFFLLARIKFQLLSIMANMRPRLNEKLGFMGRIQQILAWDLLVVFLYFPIHKVCTVMIDHYIHDPIAKTFWLSADLVVLLFGFLATITVFFIGIVGVIIFSGFLLWKLFGKKSD